MEVSRPELHPGRPETREEMVAQQERVAEAARFDDDLLQEGPVVGVDQAFPDGDAVSAAVSLEDGTIIEQVRVRRALEQPYIPGLLAFREGPSVVAALESLEVDPALLLVDGSGRIHGREAGLATHIGVCMDVPAVGVAKGLLCGAPERPTSGLEAGERVRILADESMTAPTGTCVGYAVQTRQFTSSTRHVNPLFVSPGHRVSPETAAAIVLEYADGYKLPEPIRLADAAAAGSSNQ